VVNDPSYWMYDSSLYRHSHRSAMPVATVGACRQKAEDEPGGIIAWGRSRMSTCWVGTVEYTQELCPEATCDVDVSFRVTLIGVGSDHDRSAALGVFLDDWNVDGPAAGTLPVTLTLGCQVMGRGQCQTRGAVSGTVDELESQSAGDHTVGTLVASSDAAQADPADPARKTSVDLSFSSDIFDLVKISQLGGPLRFDSYHDGLLAGREHAIWPYPPILRLNMSDPEIGESATHVNDAVYLPALTVPAWPGKTIPGVFPDSPLHRLASAAGIDANRRAACPNDPPGAYVTRWHPPDYANDFPSCDEYPFATTYEGAALTVNSAQPRFSVRITSLADNTEEGRRLGGFYGSQLLIDGDPFWVLPYGFPQPPPAGQSGFFVANVVGGGQFLTEWNRTGGARGTLGQPVGYWYAFKDSGGERQPFQHGAIYWSAATGTHEVNGAIAAEYNVTGAIDGDSRLGFPTSDEHSAPGGGRENTFSGESCGSGSAILWTGATGAHEMQGCIYDAYIKRFGGSGGPYGYPVSDEIATKGGGGRVSYMTGTSCGSQHGSGLFWSRYTATWPVHGCIFQKYEQIGEDQSGLGFPVSGEYGTADGIRQDYQNGYILSNGSGTSVFYSGSNPLCADYGPYATGPGSCSGGFSTSGTWFAGGGIGLDGKEIWTYANGSTLNSAAVYQLRNLGTSRGYEIEAYIPNGHSDATRALYKISSPGGGTADSYVDQESYTNAWANIGYVCTSDGTAQITLVDNGGDRYPLQVGADAIRAVPTGYACGI
jgi:LGFP repeat/Deoxyribonuclease NucA/NucB